MEPPICEVCGRRIHDFPNLTYYFVRFKETTEDKQERKKKEKGILPSWQPSNELCLCKDHVTEALKLKNKTAKEALVLLRKNIK
ncbi:MAG: hypothetical protein ABII22_05475 [Candidatus Micrarchaeota archaeon]